MQIKMNFQKKTFLHSITLHLNEFFPLCIPQKKLTLMFTSALVLKSEFSKMIGS